MYLWQDLLVGNQNHGRITAMTAIHTAVKILENIMVLLIPREMLLDVE